MIISREHKILFVHIQKTGGMSVSRVLKKAGQAQDFLFRHDFAIRSKEVLGEDRWKEYFKFCFVRNPWDRLLSWYRMIMRYGPRERLWRTVFENASSFEEFLIYCTDVIEERPGEKKSFAFNQLDYITDADGRLMVDFVGRYENLEEDFKRILKTAGLSPARLPHENRSRHSHYSRYYTERTKEIVAERFRRDIEAFGYTFRRCD